MASRASDGRSRPAGRRRSEAPLAEGRNGGPPPQSAARVRWFRTRVLATEEGRGRLKSWSPVVALTSAGGRRGAVANDVPRGQPGRYAVEAAVRQALSGVGGQWTARIAPLDAICVEIASPDGFRWLAFIPNPGRQKRRAMARRLKDACRRPLPSSGATRWRRAWILVTEEFC